MCQPKVEMSHFFQSAKIIFENLMDCYLELNDFKGIVSLAKRYPRDMIAPSLPYSVPLALLKLGKIEEAKKALAVAVKCLPNVVKELLKQKHKKPQGAADGYVSGSDTLCLVKNIKIFPVGVFRCQASPALG